MTRCLLHLLAASLLALAGCDNRNLAGPDPSDGADCAVFPAQASSPYVLPYEPGQSSRVIRSTQHPDPQRYAIDFDRPIGAAVVAARAGRVIEAEGRWPDTDHAFGHENRVFVQHEDGSVARYFHLTQGGALVVVGQAVVQGAVVGRSGDSGNSTMPHLHFDVVERPCGTPWPDEPWAPGCQNTVPLTFANTSTHACGLVGGQTYGARPPRE